MEWIKASITPELGAFVSQIIATLVLVVILKVFLWKPIKEFGEKRRNYIKSQYDDADKLKHETEAFILEAEAKRNEIYSTQEKIISDAKKEGEEIKAKSIEDAKFEANRKIERADDEIALAKTKASEDVKIEAANMAEIIATKLVSKSVSSEDQSKLIEEALKEINNELL